MNEILTIAEIQTLREEAKSFTEKSKPFMSLRENFYAEDINKLLDVMDKITPLMEPIAKYGHAAINYGMGIIAHFIVSEMEKLEIELLILKENVSSNEVTRTALEQRSFVRKKCVEMRETLQSLLVEEDKMQKEIEENEIKRKSLQRYLFSPEIAAFWKEEENNSENQ